VGQPFGVDPAQRVRADATPGLDPGVAGVVGNDHGVASRVLQQALMMDGAQERAFAGDEHGIWRDVQRVQAQGLQVTLPVVGR